MCAEMAERGGVWGWSSRLPSPATMIETQFIEFTVKVL